jgi:hypothetical protein
VISSGVVPSPGWARPHKKASMTSTDTVIACKLDSTPKREGFPVRQVSNGAQFSHTPARDRESARHQGERTAGRLLSLSDLTD